MAGSGHPAPFNPDLQESEILKTPPANTEAGAGAASQ